LALIALLSCACGAGAEPAEQTPASPTGAGASVSGVFTGTYEVPVTASLSDAATFSVAEVTWGANAKSASLSYKLPRELVGKSIAIELAGPVGPAGHASLSGAAGDADCTFNAVSVVCHETLAGLTPLEVDLSVVQQLATDSFAGNAQDRLDVAKLFSADPIGIANVDLSSPQTAEPGETEKRH
jgi:hypothetical protein